LDGRGEGVVCTEIEGSEIGVLVAVGGRVAIDETDCKDCTGSGVGRGKEDGGSCVSTAVIGAVDACDAGVRVAATGVTLAAIFRAFSAGAFGRGVLTGAHGIVIVISTCGRSGAVDKGFFGMSGSCRI